MNHTSEHDWSATPSEEQLERMLADAESSVSRLRHELASVRSRRVSEAEKAAQHAEIDRLSEHLSQAQVHWSEVWGFFEAALQELRSDESGSARGNEYTETQDN